MCANAYRNARDTTAEIAKKKKHGRNTRAFHPAVYNRDVRYISTYMRIYGVYYILYMIHVSERGKKSFYGHIVFFF